MEKFIEELGKILEKYKNAEVNEDNALNFYAEIKTIYNKYKGK